MFSPKSVDVMQPDITATQKQKATHLSVMPIGLET